MISDDKTRLYLDAGDLIEIANGSRLDDTSRLLGACRSHNVVLVIGMDHFRDMLPVGDADAPKQIAGALARFPQVALVTKNPYEIEPWPNPGHAVDIELEPYDSGQLDVLLSSPVAPAYLAIEAANQDSLHSALTAGHEAIRGSPDDDLHVPKHHATVRLRSMIALIASGRGDGVGAIVDVQAADEGFTLTTRERAAIVASLEPVAALVREVRPLLTTHGLEGIEVVRRMAVSYAADGYTVAPGTWLAGRLAAATQTDRRRPGRRSDVLDIYHVTFFPYVDVASCDAFVFQAVDPHVGRAKGTRTPRLFRNGRLGDIASTLEALPAQE